MSAHDAGKSPKRMSATFTTRRKLEIENTTFVIKEFIGTVKLESCLTLHLPHEIK